MRFSELKKKYDDLGRQMAELKAELEAQEIKYIFTVFVSNSHSENNKSVFATCLNAVSLKYVEYERTVIGHNPYGFCRAYLCGDDVYVVSNRLNNGACIESLNTMDSGLINPDVCKQRIHHEMIFSHIRTTY